MTTKEVSVLENEVTLMGKTFNVYGTVEEPLFRAKDVADWLDISNVSQMAQSVDEDEKGIYNVYTLGGNQGTQVSIVKSTVETGFQSGLTIQEIVNSGNIEAKKVSQI